MRKGCSFIVLILIFIIGVGYYIWQKYGEDIKEEAKERIVKIVFQNLNEKLVGINPEINADSLVNVISDRILERTKNLELDEVSEYAKEIINSISDKIDNAEFNSPDFSGIDKLIENYERKQKN